MSDQALIDQLAAMTAERDEANRIARKANKRAVYFFKMIKRYRQAAQTAMAHLTASEAARMQLEPDKLKGSPNGR